MTTKEDLWLVLSDLKAEQFKQFKWFLKDAEGDFTAIPASRLEEADQQDTVDLMVQQYGSVLKALQKTTKTLEKIQRNDLVQRLSKPTSTQRNTKNTTKLKETKLMIEERKMKMEEILRSAECSRKSAARQISGNVKAVDALIQLVQRTMNKVTDEIKERQKTAQKQAEGIIQELNQEICELEKHLCAGDQLRDVPGSWYKSWTEVGAPQVCWEDSVTTAVNALKKTLDQELKTFLSKARLNWARQFAVDLTLDPNTAHPNLVLSRDRKEVYCSAIRRELPDNPERFDTAPNVLAKQGFSSGRFYFEVQVEGKTAWDLGVVNGSIGRKGSIKAAPSGGYWTICLRNSEQYKAAGVHLTVTPPLKKVGVFVDYKKGLVSFHNVDSAERIHHFTDLFKEKLYPFFSPSNTQSGLNTSPLVLSNVS